jgi:hypothetical protein
MDICDWFDPKDKVHQKAFEHLNSVGTWPEHFIPDDITFSPSWHHQITYVMFQYYRGLYKEKRFRDELLKISEMYEQWETNLINCEKAWETRSGLPTLTQELYDELIEIQNKRNAILKKIRK